MRTIKFRRAHFIDEEMTKFSHFTYWGVNINLTVFTSPSTNNYALYHCDNQFTGIFDKNGKEIFEGDILQFSDKWEWYKGSYGIKMHFADKERYKILKEQYDNEPMERRTVEIPDFYEWGLSSEIQQYWEVVGNIYQNPELL